MQNIENVKYDKSFIIYLSSSVLLFSFLYIFIVFESINKYNSINFLLYIISLIVVVFSIYSIKKKNINSYNIFLLFYFFALFLNTINLSSKQFLKTPEDLYYFLLSPFIVVIFLYISENIQVEKLSLKNVVKFNVNSVYVVLLTSYILLKLYIGMKMGFRIMDYSDISRIVSGSDYVIPGISGISVILQWTLVILIPYVKKRYSILAIISIIILSGILNVKRGDIIRLLIFLLIYYTFIKIQLHQLTSKKIIHLFVYISIFIAIFIVFGQYRMEARGGTDSIIIEYLGSRIDTPSVAWLYSYFAFNFEILKLNYAIPASYSFIHLNEIFGASLSRETLGLETTISGFNASTFIGPYVLDFGRFFFFELFFFSVLISLLILIIRKIDFLGLYIFIAMLMSLMIFGDYLVNRAMIMSIIFALILFPFLKFKNELSIRKAK